MTTMVESGAPTAEARQLAMIAHLLGLANLAFAFAGFIGVLIVYVTAKDDFVRANARHALNMQITLAIYSAILFGAYAFEFFTRLFLPAFYHTQPHRYSPDFASIAIIFAIMGMLLIGVLVTAILNGIGARQAYLGRTFRYPIAIPFLRDPVFSEPTAAA
jgi:uncharacterized Tic20 family protein